MLRQRGRDGMRRAPRSGASLFLARHSLPRGVSVRRCGCLGSRAVRPAETSVLIGGCGRGISARPCRPPSGGGRGAGGCVGGVRRCRPPSGGGRGAPTGACVDDGVVTLLKLSRRCSWPGETGDDIDEGCERRPCGGIPPSAPPDASPQGMLCSCLVARCGDAGSKEGRRRGIGVFGSGVIRSKAALATRGAPDGSSPSLVASPDEE